MPVTVLAAPGPLVTITTPTLPVTRAYASAACVAPCSCRVRIDADRLGLVQRVEERQNHTAGVAEYDLDTLGFERLHDGLCCGHFHAFTSWSSRVLTIPTPHPCPRS